MAGCVEPARKAAGAAAGEKYGRRAVELLGEAVRRGYKEKADVLRGLPAFKPLLVREDFNKVMDELEKR